MMKFKFEKLLESANATGFEYLKDEYSISFLGDRAPSFGGVLINDLSLELDDSGEVLYLSGLCSHTLWEDRALQLPDYSFQKLIIELDSEPQIGVYHRINENCRWPVFVDKKNKLLCLGDPNVDGEAGCFLPGAVVVLNSGLPVALWLFGVDGLS